MVTKGHYHEQWKRLHPKFNAEDEYFQLSRSEQVTVLRLCTDHNKMRYHLHTKFKIGTTSLYNCGLEGMTVKHVLLECPQFTDQQNETWQTQFEQREKLYGRMESLKQVQT